MRHRLPRERRRQGSVGPLERGPQGTQSSGNARGRMGPEPPALASRLLTAANPTVNTWLPARASCIFVGADQQGVRGREQRPSSSPASQRSSLDAQDSTRAAPLRNRVPSTRGRTTTTSHLPTRPHRHRARLVRHLSSCFLPPRPDRQAGRLPGSGTSRHPASWRPGPSICTPSDPGSHTHSLTGEQSAVVVVYRRLSSPGRAARRCPVCTSARNCTIASSVLPGSRILLLAIPPPRPAPLTRPHGARNAS